MFKVFTRQERRLQNEVLQKLEDQTDYFFSEAGNNVQTLYWTLRQELMKCYPDEQDYDLPALIYVYVSLYKYIIDFQVWSDALIRGRTGCTFYSKVDPNLSKIRKLLSEIESRYRINKTAMIDLAMKVISNKIDGLIFSEVEIVDE